MPKRRSSQAIKPQETADDIVPNAAIDIGWEHRIVQAQGRRYSLKLERSFWRTLTEIAAAKHKRVSQVVAEIAARSTPRSLSSEIRVYCLDELRQRDLERHLATTRSSLLSITRACPAPGMLISESLEILHMNQGFLAWLGEAGSRLVASEQPVLAHFRFRAKRSLEENWALFRSGQATPEVVRLVHVSAGRVLSVNALLAPVFLGERSNFVCLLWLIRSSERSAPNGALGAPPTDMKTG